MMYARAFFEAMKAQWQENIFIFVFVCNLDERLECDIDDVVGLIGIMQYVKGYE